MILLPSRWSIALVAVVAATESPAPCLVLTDVAVSEFPQSYSQLTSVVENNCRGAKVTVKSVSDKSVHLNEFGEYLYSNVVFAISNPKSFAFPRTQDMGLLPESPTYRDTTKELQAAKQLEQKRAQDAKNIGGGLALNDIVAFVDSGKNVFIALQGGLGASADAEALLAEFGFGISASSPVVDHFSHLEKDAKTVLSAAPAKSEPWAELVVGKGVKVAYNGSPVGISTLNDKVFSVLRAAPTAFHATTSSQGSALSLAGSLQSINGARVTVIGSLSALSDSKIKRHADNGKFLSNVVSWTFGNRAVLRARDLYHHRVGETAAPRMYRELDDVVVGLKIEELKDGRWVPFPAMDVQIEYVMMDPHIRQFMTFTGSEHRLNFKVPDVYGIFKFKIEYNRLGFNPIKVEQVAPVRNFKHNDYPRFLLCAYPYYISCFASLALVLVFAVLFINHKDVGKKAAGEKEARHRE